MCGCGTLDLIKISCFSWVLLTPLVREGWEQSLHTQPPLRPAWLGWGGGGNCCLSLGIADMVGRVVGKPDSPGPLLTPVQWGEEGPLVTAGWLGSPGSPHDPIDPR